MRDDVPPRDSPPPRANDVWLTDITNQSADLSRGHPAPVGVHNRCVPDEPDHVVLGSSPSILVLSLDQSLAENRQLITCLIICRFAHTCQYDIPSVAPQASTGGRLSWPGGVRTRSLTGSSCRPITPPVDRH